MFGSQGNYFRETYKKDIFILGKDIYFLPGFIERAITLISEKFYLFILRLMNPSVVDYKYDLVLCSGSRTCDSCILIGKTLWCQSCVYWNSKISFDEKV